PSADSTGPASRANVLGGDLAAGRLLDGDADLDRVVNRVRAPLEPAAVVDRDARPVEEVRVEPGLGRSPAGAAVEGDPLVRGDVGLAPVRDDLGVRPHLV